MGLGDKKMNNIPKLKEFTVEELQEQLKDKKIDKEFLIEYIVERDKVYNQLIAEVNEREVRINKAIECLQKHLNETNYEFEKYQWFGREYLEDLLEILGDSNE